MFLDASRRTPKEASGISRQGRNVAPSSGQDQEAETSQARNQVKQFVFAITYLAKKIVMLIIVYSPKIISTVRFFCLQIVLVIC